MPQWEIRTKEANTKEPCVLLIRTVLCTASQKAVRLSKSMHYSWAKLDAFS